MCPKSISDFPSTPKLSTYHEMTMPFFQLLRKKTIEITLNFFLSQIPYTLSVINSFWTYFLNKSRKQLFLFTSLYDLILSYYHFQPGFYSSLLNSLSPSTTANLEYIFSIAAKMNLLNLKSSCVSSLLKFLQQFPSYSEKPNPSHGLQGSKSWATPSTILVHL